MDYWPSTRWKIAITGHGTEKWIEPDLPYALIGSHPCCAGRINETRVPPVVYLACCFADSVEVWPLCPIAFPRWGSTLPEHTLSVGKNRISLFHESHRLWPEVANHGEIPEHRTSGVGVAQGVQRKITLDWDGKPRSKVLARRVMIIGDDHPSTLRLYGQGLAHCDHAVVCVGASVWLINLNPPPEQQDPAQLCRRLVSASDPLMVGSIKVRLGRAVEKKSESQEPASRLDPTDQPRALSEQAALRDSGPVELDPSGTTERMDPSTPEAMTSKLTDQLVRIDHARFTRRRIIRISAYVAGFLISLVIVLWIVLKLLIPMITEMMG